MTTDLARLKALPLPLHIDEEFNIVDVNKKVILQTAYIDLLDGWITKDLVNALNALPEMISELEALRRENAKLKNAYKTLIIEANLIDAGRFEMQPDMEALKERAEEALKKLLGA